MTTSTATWVAYCRAGFEPEAASDLQRMAATLDAPIAVLAPSGAGYVLGRGRTAQLSRLEEARVAAPPIFVRTVLAAGDAQSLPGSADQPGRADRVTPLLAAIDARRAQGDGPWQSVWVEYPDTNDGKELSPLARSLEARLDGAMRACGTIHADATLRLHVFLTAGTHALVGTSSDPERSAWPLGIPRLRMPGGAPSRSTLKLAEAFAVLLDHSDRAALRPGLHAVDLGAAPGGWTWQLARRGLKVTAIDNGPLKGSVAEDPLVTHLREDGLRWRPRRAVDWLVCDIVEQPLRIAEMIGHWIADGATRRAIFNLKLPMKKRYDEVRRCEASIARIIDNAGLDHTLRMRQLYHDREEVTAYVKRVD
ncbi:MAG: 23S rRNA (cytidine(2498)-2'-O)-methyltransferase RlmM [Casimicrobiaceae bacterium]